MLLNNNRRRRAAMLVAMLGLTMLLGLWHGSPALAHGGIPVDRVSFTYGSIHIEYNNTLDAAVLADAVELPIEEDESLVVKFGDLPVFVRDDETGDETTGYLRFDVTGSQDGRIAGQADLRVDDSRNYVFNFTRVELKFDNDGRFNGLELFGQGTIDGHPPFDVTANIDTEPAICCTEFPIMLPF